MICYPRNNDKIVFTVKKNRQTCRSIEQYCIVVLYKTNKQISLLECFHKPLILFKNGKEAANIRLLLEIIRQLTKNIICQDYQHQVEETIVPNKTVLQKIYV